MRRSCAVLLVNLVAAWASTGIEGIGPGGGLAGTEEHPMGAAGRVSVRVPGHYTSFREAIDKVSSEVGQVEVLQGEHRWENFLEVSQRLDIHGTTGALLPGSLWMKKGSGGQFQGIEMLKDSGSCIIFEGGQWNLESCKFSCSKWAVLWCRCDSEVSVKNCLLTGLEEGPGYCVNCQDHTRVIVENSRLERSGGEFSAAVALFHSVNVRVHNCVLRDSQFALRAVGAKDASFELTNSNIQGELWYDGTRPGSLMQRGNTHNGVLVADSPLLPV